MKLFHHFLSWFFCGLVLFWFPVIAFAQPSGGPYGPVEQVYEIPEAEHVYYVAPDGSPESKGLKLNNPSTLQAVIARVTTGDAIVLRGGTYRTGSLKLNQGITLQPYQDERPVLNGTRIANDWEALRDNVWRTSWKELFPVSPLGWWRREREGMRTPLHRFNNDMVFINGKLLTSVGWEGELDSGSYYIDYQNEYVYIGVDPTDKLVEITAHDSALVRTSLPVHGKTTDHQGPVIRGIEFRQYAYRALEIEGKKQFTAHDEPTDEPVGLSDPDTFGKETTGTLIENVTIAFCSRVAGYFRGDGLVIRNSLISDTGTEGIYVIGSSDVLLERNIIRRNNIEQLTGYYPAAVKIFNQTRRVTFSDNLIIDQPYSNGVWYDVGNRDGIIVNNWIEGTKDGFFFEISEGATVAGNVFVRNDKGIRVLNSADVHVYHNTFLDSPASFERNERGTSADHFGWHASTGPDVSERDGHVFANNLMVANSSFTRPLLQFEQPPSMCEAQSEPMAEKVDGNVYVRTNASGSEAPALVKLSPVRSENCAQHFSSLEAFRQHSPAFEARGTYLDLNPRSVFRSPELGRYDVQTVVPVGPLELLPLEVLEIMNWSPETARSSGAFLPIE